MVSRARHAHHLKRHGKHQKQTKHFVKVYWPYLPLLFIVLTGLVFSNYWQPRTRSSVMAYATSMSVSSLLNSTNTQRGNNGAASLSINSQLNQAAQAKANDMASRDYWSHNTPEGNPPWVFIDAAGYDYQKAGENLAYGFMTSEDTVSGWMNSPTHKDNMLDKAYVDVGFGFANSSDYQDTGPETIVVAMYGKPQVAAATAAPTPTAAAAEPVPAPAVQNQSTAQQQTQSSTPTPTSTPTETSTPPEPSETKEEAAPQPVTTEQKEIVEPAPQKVARISAFTKGSMPWIASVTTLITFAGLGILVIKHGINFRRFMTQGERFVLHHPLFDITVISLIGLVYVLNQTAGFIR